MGKPKYGCEECGRDYQSKAAADRHIRDKHNGNANRIPYAQLIADVGKGKHFEHIVGGLPSRVRRPDFGFIILEELCRGSQADGEDILSRGISGLRAG